MLSLLLVPILAQVLVAPSGRAWERLERMFTPAPTESSLGCRITAIPPRVGFSFLNWSGLNVELPLKLLRNPGQPQEIFVAISVQTKDGKKVFLAERMGLPAYKPEQVATKGVQLGYTAGYYLGVGEYRVSAVVIDGEDRTCRSSWNLKIRAGKVPQRLAPNEVNAVGFERWKGLPGGKPERRVTVVVDAAPLFPRRNSVRISSYDRSVLLGSLTSLLDTGNFTSARVIALDSRGRKVILKAETFSPRDFGALARGIAEVNLGVVSLQTLQGPGDSAFLEQVLTESAAEDSEAVIFLGPTLGWRGKLTPRLRELGAGLPPLYYLSLTRLAGLPDNLITNFVRASSGTVKQVFTPDDLAKAISKLPK